MINFARAFVTAALLTITIAGVILTAIMFFGSKLEAQHGPGHVTCDFKWMETGKPATEYEKFMQDCLAVEAPDAPEAPHRGGDTSFIEAATFFLTGVDATGDEIISERVIILSKYPLRVNLVDDKRCAVRLRNTSSSEIWQLDFCKLMYYQRDSISGDWVWRGKPDAFCRSTWNGIKNFTDPDFTKTGNPVQCALFGAEQGNAIAFLGAWDGYMFANGKIRVPIRSQERLMASFKYIQSLLKGKPY